MDLKLKDKVVLVTGSSRGLGLGIIEVFLQEDAKIIVTGRHKEEINEVVKNLIKIYPEERIKSFCGDLTKFKNIKNCVDFTLKNFGRIDILIANLGSGKGTIDWDISENDWNNMMEINFYGARRIVNEVVPYMIKQNNGSIVFISSIAGIEVIGAPIHYSVAKAALKAYSKNLSKKLARNNIRVNTVCPGNIFFEGGTWDIKLKENKEKVLEMINNVVPLNRFASPEEIANVVVFVSSEKSSFLTGSCITVDGGQTVSV